MHYRLLIIIATTLFLYSCESESGFTIKGNIQNAVGKSIYFKKYVRNMPIIVDSTQIDANGDFELESDHLPLDFYGVTLDHKQYINLILDSTDELVINADAEDINETVQLSGSENSIELLKYYRTATTQKRKIDSLYQVIRGLPRDAEGRDQLMDEYNGASKTYITYIKSYIDQNPESPVCMAMVYDLSIKNEYDYYEIVSTKLASKMKKSSSFQNFRGRVQRVKSEMQAKKQQEEMQRKLDEMYKPGNEVPDIVLNDVNGKQLKLSSLRGRTVLIDFWASWCKPCRFENPNVVKVYKKYNKRGFEIFSVSLDNNRTKWAAAIQQDNLLWPSHVSDLGGWNSSVVPLYGISSIPFTVLIDEDGKVIDKNLRGGLLGAKLKEIYGV